MNYLFILLDDIGSVVTSTLIFGIIAALSIIFLAVKLTKEMNAYKIIVFIVCGLLLLVLITWFVLNNIGHL